MSRQGNRKGEHGERWTTREAVKAEDKLKRRREDKALTRDITEPQQPPKSDQEAVINEPK